MSPPSTSTRAAETPAIDPRMRARRIEVKRSDGRRRLHRLLVLVALAGAVAGVLVALRSPLLDVDRIRITGATHTPADQLRAATGVRLHEAMVDVDAGEVRTRLLHLPWVLDAKVERRWPGTVSVTVSERTPVATIASLQGYALVDATGRILEVDPAPPAGLVALSGLPPAGVPGAAAPAGSEAAVSVAAALPAGLRSRVGAISVTASGEVDLHVTGVGLVHLGALAAPGSGSGDLAAKLLATVTVLDQVDLADLCAIDVRVPTAPTLTRGGTCL